MLFDALALFTKLYHKPMSVGELTSGLPFDASKKGPEIFSCDNMLDNFARAAERCGLRTRLAERTLDDIGALTLPLILITKKGGGVILDSISEDRKKFRIVSPEAGDSLIWADRDKLEADYSNHLFYIGKGFGASDEHGKAPITGVRGHWFWETIKYSWPLYSDVLKASVVVNIFVLASPLFTMNVYDRVVPNNAIETLWVLGTGIIVVTLLDTVLKMLRSYFIEIAAKKSDIIISARLFEKTLDLKVAESPKNIGAYANNFREFDSIRTLLTSAVMLTLVDLPFTALTLFVIYLIGGKLVIVPVIIMCLLLIYSLIVKAPMKESMQAGHAAASRKSSLLIESLSGMRDIKIMNAAGIFQWRWENGVAEAAATGIKARMLSASVATMTGLLMQLDTVFIVIYGTYLIRDLELTMGGLIAVVILCSRTIAPIGQVVALISNYEQAKVAFDTINLIMKKDTENPPGCEFIRKETLEGEIEFQNVTFTYPEAEKPAIEGISFKVKKGERVALIGRTGSGKSTIQRLLINFYKPEKGSIRIDGLDIGQLSPVLLRKNVSCVPQDFSLFSGTIRENITLAAPHASDEAVIEAARTGGLEAFLRACPRGLETRVEERGANLSGGQKQGIAIARAFINPSTIFILDEPTSSMDGATEDLVKDMIKKRTEGKTVVFTTHKPAMLDVAERIIMLDTGKIVFDGKRDDFMKKFVKPAEPVK